VDVQRYFQNPKKAALASGKGKKKIDKLFDNDDSDKEMDKLDDAVNLDDNFQNLRRRYARMQGK
jgi:hypothetical protein